MSLEEQTDLLSKAQLCQMSYYIYETLLLTIIVSFCTRMAFLTWKEVTQANSMSKKSGL